MSSEIQDLNEWNQARIACQSIKMIDISRQENADNFKQDLLCIYLSFSCHNIPGTWVGPGGHDRMLAVKSRIKPKISFRKQKF